MMYTYLSSDYIRDFIIAHPVNRADEKKHLMKRKRKPPGMAMGMFYQLLEQKGRLFTQYEFWKYLEDKWRVWFDSLTKDEKEAFGVRVYRGFYLAGIDQLYVQALLHESKLFSRVTYDISRENFGVDLIAYLIDERVLEVGLRVGTVDAEKADNRRREQLQPNDTITIVKPTNNCRYGNMLFYEQEDLRPLYLQVFLNYYYGRNKISVVATSGRLQVTFHDPVSL